MTGPQQEARAARTTPPGPPRRATIRLLKQLFTDRLALMGDNAGTYGDVVRIAIGPKAMYLVNHPDLAKHVLADNAANYHKGIGLQEARRALGDGLLTSDGDTWRKQRRTIQPVFQPKRISRQAGVVAAEVETLVKRLATHEGPVEILHEMTGLTLGVLGKTLLDAELGGYETLGHSFEAVQDQAMFEAVTLSMVPQWVPLKKQLEFRTARDDLRRIADELVDQRLANPIENGEDVLSRLIATGADSGDATAGASRERMRDELITLLLAGHETTASTLGWAFHLIDEHPEVRERLHAEAVEVLGERLPEYEDLRRLTFTVAVVEEVMRLYPPVWLLPRIAQADDEIGGYHVPAGSDVVVVPYTLHRNPEFWTDPERFDPGRFDPANPAGRPPRYAYLPFGAGPRFCIGNSLGVMEAVFVLAMTARDLELRKVPGKVVEPEAMLSLRVRGGLPMTVHPRAARAPRDA
jgi:enediyne biosynthesis protein E7